jgi:hypothetical protein
VKVSCNKKCKKNIMEKRASEEGGTNVTKNFILWEGVHGSM